MTSVSAPRPTSIASPRGGSTRSSSSTRASARTSGAPGRRAARRLFACRPRAHGRGDTDDRWRRCAPPSPSTTSTTSPSPTSARAGLELESTRPACTCATSTSSLARPRRSARSSTSCPPTARGLGAHRHAPRRPARRDRRLHRDPADGAPTASSRPCARCARSPSRRKQRGPTDSSHVRRAREGR